ncbi:formyltransferase family protein [Lysinibacillus piscis]|uniref:Methionyl-tRNA formyltransferase n=1 Tax=Lysinibacillus piscis TaxID=2518931 RepID=A0ABQ5NIA0_9BACI|nr:formyltransferase family protein [Lysinibacillus sp. KH24]GLC87817.1 hypothetical protein LYSBPC_09440 [Lysinibacillus sp. KH24]
MKYVFVGNRVEVFKQMQKLNCEIIGVFAVKDSFLEKYLLEIGYQFNVIHNKESLIEKLNKLSFNCLVSNGCPYVLPVSKMSKMGQLFINIHPSLLPDLKGKHPINGALLYERKHGVTCHLMDDGIDTGKIITRIKIPINENIDLDLLYKITFLTEAEVFKKAYNQNFIPSDENYNIDSPIYYSRKNEDLVLNKSDSLEVMIRKIRAFGIPSLGAKMYRKGQEYKILSVKVIESSNLESLFNSSQDGELLLNNGRYILVKKQNKFIYLELEKGIDLRENEMFFE